MTEKNPFRLLPLVAATFPKGTASEVATKFPALPKGVPLRADFPRPGEDVAQRQKGESVAVGDWGSLAPVHTSFTSLLLSVLCGLWYTMVNMGHHGYITDSAAFV